MNGGRASRFLSRHFTLFNILPYFVSDHLHIFLFNVDLHINNMPKNWVFFNDYQQLKPLQG